MCGICGVWGQVEPESVARMVAALHHRGPDDSGTYVTPAASLGMARLSILDLSPSGHQPMCTPDELIWIVYNGELYNFQAERAALEARGVGFQSTSDTEVVLRMYEQYGERFLERLRGMFALAILDRRAGPGREKLLLARDQLGIKPLLYAEAGGRVVFASEIKAILSSDLVERAIDPVGLRQLLTFGSVYQPRTMLRGVSMLPPAHYMLLERDRPPRIERYWRIQVDRFAGRRTVPYPELVDELASLLEESVHLQMVSDVPLGAFLSGGVDSSILAAILARAAGKRIRTFSVGFEAEGAAIDESADASRTARHLGTDHHAVVVRGGDVRDRIRHIVAGLDQPSVDGVNSYFVSWAARQGGLTVALSGTGGDELFAGYPWFIDMAHMDRQAPRPWRRLAVDLARQSLWDRLSLQKYGRAIGKLRANGDFVSRYGGLYQIFGVQGAGRILNRALWPVAQVGRAPYFDLLALDEVPEGDPIERVTALCLRGYTNNQLLRDIDAVSMAHSLEVRVPYLDPVMLDFAMSLPESAKLGDVSRLDKPSHTLTYRESGAKRILIDVGMRYLPEGFDQQPKRGFAMPFAAWMNGPLKDVFAESLSEKRLRERGLFDVPTVLVTREQFLKGQIAWAQPWLLMMIELWCQEVLDRPIPGEASLSQFALHTPEPKDMIL